MSSPKPDPCAGYENNGVVDVGHMLDDAGVLVACALSQISDIQGAVNRALYQHVAEALRHVKIARDWHKYVAAPTKPID